MVSIKVRREIEAMGHVLGTFIPVLNGQGYGASCLNCGGTVYVDNHDRVAKSAKLKGTCEKRVVIKRRDL